MATKGKKSELKKPTAKKPATKKATVKKAAVIKKEVVQKHEAEISDWQKKIEEIKLQLNQGSKEAQELLKKELNKLEKELGKAKKEIAEFDAATTSAWEEISKGLGSSFDTMKEAYNKAKDFYK